MGGCLSADLKNFDLENWRPVPLTGPCSGRRQKQGTFGGRSQNLDGGEGGWWWSGMLLWHHKGLMSGEWSSSRSRSHRCIFLLNPAGQKSRWTGREAEGLGFIRRFCKTTWGRRHLKDSLLPCVLPVEQSAGLSSGLITARLLTGQQDFQANRGTAPPLTPRGGRAYTCKGAHGKTWRMTSKANQKVLNPRTSDCCQVFR